MSSYLSQQIFTIMEREMQEMGAPIVRKQCQLLAIDCDDIQPRDLPKLARALSEVMKAFSGIEKAKKLNQEILGLENLTRLIDKENDISAKIEMMLSAGDSYHITGEWDKAMSYFGKLLDIPEVSEKPELIIKIRRRIASVKMEMGVLGEAREGFQHCLDAAEEIDDEYELAEAYRGLGHICWMRGDFADGSNYLEQALEKAKGANDVRLMGEILIDLGNVYSDMGEESRGLTCYRESIEHLEKAEDHSSIARAYNNIGDTYLQKMEWDDALKYFDLCMKAAEKAGNVDMKAWAYFNMAEALTRKMELDKAKKFLDESVYILRKLGDKPGLSGAYKGYGLLYTQKGRWVNALDYFNKALKISSEIGALHERAMILFEMGQMYIDKGDRDKARASLKESLGIYQKLKIDKAIEVISEQLSRV